MEDLLHWKDEDRGWEHPFELEPNRGMCKVRGRWEVI